MGPCGDISMVDPNIEKLGLILNGYLASVLCSSSMIIRLISSFNDSIS